MVRLLAPLTEVEAGTGKSGSAKFLTQVIDVAAQQVQRFGPLHTERDLQLVAGLRDGKAEAAKVLGIEHQFDAVV